MKKILIAVFCTALALLFVWLLIQRPALSKGNEARRSPRTIIPAENNGYTGTNSSAYDATAFDESRPQPLILLNNNEIFLQALSVDLNRDGMTDQVCAVRKTGEPDVYLIAGTQNPISGEYVRLPDIKTGITQARTLLLYSTDLIGDRSSPIIASGMTSDNNHALSVYLPEVNRSGSVTLISIADLQSDGPITIKELSRSDAYNSGVTSGESYPIHTYNSDPRAPETLDQIERIYLWNRKQKHYEQISESRIPGKRLESRLVSQLQGATLETFEEFLTGLWYLPASTGKQGNRYLFFNTQTREITFQNSSVQEVFIRESGAPRRYGAYLTTRNKSISSIRRMIDIELTGIDEIKIKVLEDVKLKIGVASDWDGIYRKMSDSSFPGQNQEGTIVVATRKMLTEPDSGWVSDNGQKITLSPSTYTLNTASGTESGSYAVLTIQDQVILQLRSTAAENSSRFFTVTVENKEEPISKRKLILKEVYVSIEGLRSAGDDPVTFSADN